MPSVTHERIPSAKKRRRDDVENSYTSGNIQIPLYADYTSNYPSPLQLANPTSLYTSSHPALDTTRGILADKSSYANPTALHPYPPTLRKIIPIAINKKQRMSVSDDVHHREDSHHGMRAKSNSPTSASHPHHQKQHALLSKIKCLDRCHICFRKPSKKADLDSYADCQGCGQRTCYVCMRQCPGWTSSFHQQERHPHTGEQEAQTQDIPLASSSPENSFTMVDADAEAEADYDALAEKESQRPRSTPGWHANGHRETICGQCCEERGDNGDVVCFGCLPSFGG
ncbi:hypothetical protein B0H65DRAFT_505891 [Neurospora tetraspora]|uniref:Uncharacterized protein n=1 Tax=Neurospora tetraspora TaxID=94610 RepID=A0AAE0MXN3_9PEZI|nr:hypothetical protein B0H65DRAFT_505891 [Neurospora tetraspora]